MSLSRVARFGWLLLIGGVLSACRVDPAPQMHELTIAGAIEQRITWFYGEPRSFTLAGVARELASPPAPRPPHPWFAIGALWVDGEAAVVEALESGIDAPAILRRIPATSDLQLSTQRETRALLYYDGNFWFTIGEFDPAGLSVRVVPRQRFGGLRNLGELTSSEAEALRQVLERLGGPLVVAFLTDAEVPRRVVDGVAEARATAIHVTQGVEIDPNAFRPAPRDVPFEIVAQGQQALGIDRPEYRLIRSQDALRDAWNAAHGAALAPPPTPSVDFARETILGIFLGTRPTGGYAVAVRGVAVEGTDLFVDLDVRSPAPGAMVTQALTSPWAIVRVPRGRLDAVWFRDATGTLIAVARAEP
jgi:hypothetical protein